VSLVLNALLANTAVWAKTALFLMYDENDGWFDHVPPPTAPAGTPGEYLTATPSSTLEPGYSSQTLGISGPLGLGVRVPAIVISPFSRGGNVVSQVFDHTSQLKLVAERFGVQVANVSQWRLSTVGDLTATLGSKPNTSVPALPSPPVPIIQLSGSCSTVSQDTEQGGADPDVPAVQTMPTQQGTTVPATRYDTSAVSRPPTCRTANLTAAVSRGGGRPMTLKSSYNRLAYPRAD
ncbi:MAG: alkaline phosphatase family protein, partial [Streptosporangiaceae bacterium]